ncbi:cell division protein FtsI/penicillin-binding protein 2 [Thermoanaerobacterium thermosaccharolyticum M0795]|uniref:Cell division protein FtsI/penicillin-binding protein 2 n=1 Tax=Thermoanaerobacterium thermosaccharolyticum M0795 TaxID=698948 RepID=L0IEJ2_THETR|nr:penicillin-binding protein 2 [Thermoanaerobacterium thermosaccharolyticum]AGB17960.1 cell division protein FtsI/penicillin-binding protein 2 [Thermoanaerobacterium thermosaccharolyticum M0795]
MDDNIKIRFRILGWVIAFMLITLIGRLVYLQLIKGDYYKEQSLGNAIRSIIIPAPRGDIVDRNGVKLATNRPSYSVELLRSDAKGVNLNDVILKLLNILNKNGVKYKDDLPIFLDGNNNPYFNFQNPDESNVSQSVLKQRELQWKKNNNIPSNATASEGWQLLINKFNISKSLPPQDIRGIMAVQQLMLEQGYTQYKPAEITTDANQQTVAEIEENHLDLPGVIIEVKPIRLYPFKTLLSQTLGYIGRMTAEEWKKYSQKGYQITDLVGHYGLESYLEKYLRGTDGKQQVEVDHYGRLIKKLDEVSPKPGDTVYLTIDEKLEQVAEESLQRTMENIRQAKRGPHGEYLPSNIGAVVVTDINTGEILALASVPDYDPNIFASGNPPSSIVNELFKPRNATIDPSPIFNYATQGAAPPGSTFKMVTALAALESGVTTVNERYVDPGIYPPTGQENWLYGEYGRTQGAVNVSDAIQYSTDTYFYEMGRRMGIDKIDEYAHMLGLDQKTGIELYETTGTISSKKFKRDYNLSILKSMVRSDSNPNGKITQEQYDKIVSLIDKGNFSDYSTFLQLKKMGITDPKLQMTIWQLMDATKWTLVDTTNASIGQGSNQFTPIEIASYLSTLLNGGTRYRLHLVDKIVSPDGKVIEKEKPEVLDKINIPQKYLDAIKLGMKRVTEENGTASAAFANFPIPVGGKTGTAEVGSHGTKVMQNYAWYVGFAPYDKPQILVTALIYQGGSGAYTAYIARDIMKAYFKLNYKN